MHPRPFIAALVVALVLTLTACAPMIPGTARPAGPAPVGQVPEPATGPGGPAPPIVPATPRENPRVVESGFSSYVLPFSDGWRTSYAAVVHNPDRGSSIASSVQLRVTLRDAGGTVMSSDDLVMLHGLAPGRTSAVAATTYGTGSPAEVTRMEVEILQVRWIDAAEAIPGDIEMGPATVRPDTSGTALPTVLVDCSARSTFRSKLASLSVVVVYRDGGGRIIGGSSHGVDGNGDRFAPPGDAVTPISITARSVPPSGVPAASCYSSFGWPL